MVDAIGGVLVLALAGTVDAASAEKLAGCFDRAVAAQRPVVLDLCSVTAFPNEAVEAMKKAYSRLGTRLHVVCRRSDPAWTALRAAEVAHLFIVHASRPRALSAAAPR